jgi:hypothetical protein
MLQRFQGEMVEIGHNRLFATFDGKRGHEDRKRVCARFRLQEEVADRVNFIIKDKHHKCT